MKNASNFCRSRDDDGFTVMEALISLSISSLLVVACLSILMVTWRGLMNAIVYDTASADEWTYYRALSDELSNATGYVYQGEDLRITMSDGSSVEYRRGAIPDSYERAVNGYGAEVVSTGLPVIRYTALPGVGVVAEVYAGQGRERVANTDTITFHLGQY